MNRIGKYNILERIGKGGMGIVYRARDTVLHREVALKAHTVGPDPDGQSVERFFREARVIASFEHQNIVTLFDLGRDRDKVFIAMELLEGKDLAGVLASGRHISLEEKLRIVESISGGLAHAHDRGIVHRDIKPRNVSSTPYKVVIANRSTSTFSWRRFSLSARPAASGTSSAATRLTAEARSQV